MKSNRHVHIIYGIVFCSIGLFLLFNFVFWLWTILGVLLIGLGIMNFKIGIFASDKAMKDLTNNMDKDVRLETKEEIDKIFYKNIEKKTNQMGNLRSLTSDIKPDSWVTFYLFYFNQGLGADASFQIGNRLVHIFVENLLSSENSEAIIAVVAKKYELAVGEFMDILFHLSDYDIDQFKSSAGVALVMEKQSGKAESTFFKNKEDIKAFVMNLRSQGAQQLH